MTFRFHLIFKTSTGWAHHETCTHTGPYKNTDTRLCVGSMYLPIIGQSTPYVSHFTSVL